MTTATRCVCCDRPTYSCGKAVEQEARADAARRAGELVARGWFPAMYSGTCEGCGQRFDEGALIGLEWRAQPPGWRAECCA